MYLIVSEADLARLKPETVVDLLCHLRRPVLQSGGPSATAPVNALPAASLDTELDYEDVVDLTPSQAADLMDGIKEESVDALRLFAEHGPIIEVELLIAGGVENLGRFQAGITRRTRTITGNKNALLFAWDEWAWDEEKGVLSGRYGVTQATYTAFRKVFDFQ